MVHTLGAKEVNGVHLGKLDSRRCISVLREQSI